MAVLEPWLDQAAALLGAKLRNIDLAIQAAPKLSLKMPREYMCFDCSGRSPARQLVNLFFGGTSVDHLSRQLQSAIASPQVGSIVLDVDSVGGSVSGIQETSDQIYQG
jgi:hypothetical protein